MPFGLKMRKLASTPPSANRMGASMNLLENWQIGYASLDGGAYKGLAELDRTS
jgi:hypothetical protein